MAKALDAFRTISEVADELDVQKHVLRFWENKFPQVRPMKRGGGRRYYRPDDLDLLRGIRFLLHREGYTIKGVQKLLREQGLEFVKSCWQRPEVAPPAPPETPKRKGKSAAKQTSPDSPQPRPVEPFPQPAPMTRAEHVARLKALAAELEACRQTLLGADLSSAKGKAAHSAST